MIHDLLDHHLIQGKHNNGDGRKRVISLHEYTHKEKGINMDYVFKKMIAAIIKSNNAVVEAQKEQIKRLTTDIRSLMVTKQEKQKGITSDSKKIQTTVSFNNAVH